MKFRVTRTSLRGRDKPPTSDAHKVGKDEFGEAIYEIEIISLEALLQFCRDEGEAIFYAEKSPSQSMPTIEIYDDFRE